jgi:hypothetical protein
MASRILIVDDEPNIIGTVAPPSSPKYILTEPWVGYRFADL